MQLLRGEKDGLGTDGQTQFLEISECDPHGNNFSFNVSDMALYAIYASHDFNIKTDVFD